MVGGRLPLPYTGLMDATDYRMPYREYVAAIYELAEEGIPVIQARIADWLGLSRASVSEMIKRMTDEGLVTSDGEVMLAEEGRHLAEVVVRRHRLAERFLSEVLMLPWVKVHAEAEVWEHVISDDVEAAMWKALGDPKTCPHGNPIPGAGYKPPPIKPLSTLVTGDSRTLERISEELELDAAVMGFLDDAEIRPGAVLSVVAATPDGTLTVRSGDSPPVGVGSFIAERLFVAVG